MKKINSAKTPPQITPIPNDIFQQLFLFAKPYFYVRKKIKNQLLLI